MMSVPDGKSTAIERTFRGQVELAELAGLRPVVDRVHKLGAFGAFELQIGVPVAVKLSTAFRSMRFRYLSAVSLLFTVAAGATD